MAWMEATPDGNLKRTCPPELQEAHEAHMRLNGECPWCYAVDDSKIDPNMVICEAHGNPDCGLCE